MKYFFPVCKMSVSSYASINLDIQMKATFLAVDLPYDSPLCDGCVLNSEGSLVMFCRHNGFGNRQFAALKVLEELSRIIHKFLRVLQEFLRLLKTYFEQF